MKTLESIAGRHAIVACGECQCEGPPCAALIELLREAQRALLEEIGEIGIGPVPRPYLRNWAASGPPFFCPEISAR